MGPFEAPWATRLPSRPPFGIGGGLFRRPAANNGPEGYGCGCSSGVEHDLAKVGVEGSNPFARSKILQENQTIIAISPCDGCFPGRFAAFGEARGKQAGCTGAPYP